MANKFEPRLFAWLMRPSTLLSLSAVIISGATFFLVHVRKGTIELTLPQQIGLDINPTTLQTKLLIAATFSSTGAPARQHHVHNITAVITPKDGPEPKSNYKWTYEKRLVGADEWLRKYPEEENNKHADYLEYVSRAIPFTIKGGDSASKLIELEESNPSSPGFPRALLLELRAHSKSKIYATTARYNCPADDGEVDSFNYCEREDTSN